MSTRIRRIRDKGFADDWTVLWLVPDAPIELVHAAYRILSKKYHPDDVQAQAHPNHEAQVQLNSAYDRLCRLHDRERPPMHGDMAADV